MALERKLGYAATGTGLVGAGLLLGPEHAPQDWTFVHHNEAIFHDAGYVFLGTTIVLASIMAAMRMKDQHMVDADSRPTIIPSNPGDVAAGRRHDQRRAKRKPFRW